MFGVLDPNDAKNAVITDIQLGKDATDGMVHNETTFTITKPVYISKASGFMWHDVPNRGGAISSTSSSKTSAMSASQAYGRQTTRARRRTLAITPPVRTTGSRCRWRAMAVGQLV